jgi:GntR family transcriptional regulator
VDTSTPLHHQIATALRSEIQSGQFAQGDHFTTEKQLVARFGVSVTTVRRALQTLVDEGYLVRRAGLGTFVRRPQFEPFSSPLLGFLEEMEARGIPARARVLASAERQPAPEVAAKLRLEDGEPVFWVRRLHYALAEPVAIDEIYWSADISRVLSGHDLAIPVYAFLEERLGLQLGEAEVVIEARAANAEEADLLLVPEGTPVLVSARTVYAADGRPIDVDRTVVRGDRYRFQTRTVRRPPRRLGSFHTEEDWSR